ncbi:MAG: 4Fe-4S binding protein [Kiritimatiellae bacterium]|nr:4Fe-4S binding protein [Kiritimatiellia bacterium]
MAKQFYVRVDLERCKGCELCVDACPRDLLIMSKRLNSKGYRVPDNHSDERCIGCRQCVDMCPEAAIEMDKEDVSAPDRGDMSAENAG